MLAFVRVKSQFSLRLIFHRRKNLPRAAITQLRRQQDFEKLAGLPGIDNEPVLPKGQKAAHRSPDDLDISLGEDAEKALREWYQEDYELVALCKEMMSRK